MPFESGATVSIGIIPETTRGVTPTVTPGDLLLQRLTSRNVNPQKDLLQSAEVRPDRLEAPTRHGFRQSVGSLGFELSLHANDVLLETCLGGTWTNIAGASSGTISFTAVTDTPEGAFTGSDFVADGWLIGDTFTAAGFAEPTLDNQDFMVTAVSAATLNAVRMDGTTVQDATGDADETLTAKGQRLIVGQALKTFTIERRLGTTGWYQVFTGCAMNTMQLALTPGNNATVTMDVLGMDFAPLSNTSLDPAPTPVIDSPAFNGFDGLLTEGGKVFGAVSAMDNTLSNNHTNQAVLFSPGSPDIFQGVAGVAGNMSALFEDEVLLNKFINETPSTVLVHMESLTAGEYMNLVLPVVKYNSGNMDPPQTGPVPQEMAFTLDPNTSGDGNIGSNMALIRSSAPA